MYDVTIEDAPARRLAANAHKGPYMEIGPAFEALGAVIAARRLRPQACGMVGVYYDDPDATPAADLRSHAGVILAPDAELPEGLEPVTLAAGKVATLHFKGPYAGLNGAYDYLYRTWLPASDQELRDAPSFALYLNSPMDTAPGGSAYRYLRAGQVNHPSSRRAVSRPPPAKSGSLSRRMPRSSRIAARSPRPA